MNGINHVVLLGHLTRDPHLRSTPSGTPVCDAGLALNRQWQDVNGDTQRETTFVDLTFWGRQGEIVSAFCRKGTPIGIEGRLLQESWTTPAGEKRSRLKVVATRFTLLGRGEPVTPEGDPLPEWVKEDV